jgi:alpha-L-arabinofuranosidase
VACGYDHGWNETHAGGWRAAGLSVHYYTVRGAESKDKGPSTGFPVSDWYAVLRNAPGNESFIDRTTTIMDRYDAQRRVATVMDEWGTWHTT